MAPPSWQHSGDVSLDSAPEKPRPSVKPAPFASGAQEAYYSRRDENVHAQGPAQASESRRLRESFKNRNTGGGADLLSWGGDDAPKPAPTARAPMPIGRVAKEDTPPFDESSDYASARAEMRKIKEKNSAAGGMFDVMNH